MDYTKYRVVVEEAVKKAETEAMARFQEDVLRELGWENHPNKADIMMLACHLAEFLAFDDTKSGFPGHEPCPECGMSRIGNKESIYWILRELAIFKNWKREQ